MAGPESFVIAGTKSSISTLFCVGDSAFWSISLHSPLVDETLLIPIGLLLTAAAAATAATVAIDTDLGLAPVPVTLAPNEDMMFSNLLMCTGDVGVVATSIGDMLRLILEGTFYELLKFSRH